MNRQRLPPVTHTDALFANQSQSIMHDHMALLGQSSTGNAPRRATADRRFALGQASLERLFGLRREQALRCVAPLCRRSPLERRQIQRAGSLAGCRRGCRSKTRSDDKVRFAPDSPVEGTGFELSVPRRPAHSAGPSAETAILGLPKPTTARMIPPRRQSIGPKLGRSLETATCLVRN